MTHKTYLGLVNDAISEAKVTLDPLTPSNFANPPRTVLYNLFKQWVNRVYKQVLINRNEWYYRIERAAVVVHPRLQLRLIGANTVNIGDVLVGDSSGVTFEIVDLHTAEDVENDATTEYTVSVTYAAGATGCDSLVFNELFSRTSPSAAAAIGRIKGRGGYDLHELVPYIYKVDTDSFVLQPEDTLNSADLRKLEYTEEGLNSAHGPTLFDLFSTASGTPAYVVRSPDGNYDFYPRLNTSYELGFTFSQEVKLMTAYDDTPELLDEKYDDLLMWMALAEYADWDERPKIFSRATKNIKKWNFIMDRDELPTVTMNTRRFDYGTV